MPTRAAAVKDGPPSGHRQRREASLTAASTTARSGVSGDRSAGGELQFRQHAGEDFEAEVFLVFEAVGTPLDDANLVVEALDKAE